jgi:hypothetical protein
VRVEWPIGKAKPTLPRLVQRNLPEATARSSTLYRAHVAPQLTLRLICIWEKVALF